MALTSLLLIMALAVPTLVLPAAADLGAVNTTTVAQPASSVVSSALSRAFQSLSSVSGPVDLPSQPAITTVVTNITRTTIGIPPTSTSTVVETATTTTTATTTITTSWGDRMSWAAPPQMTDLSAFNVTYFPSGKKNVDVIDGFSVLSGVPGRSAYPQNTTNFTAALQLVYPADSVNPSSASPGGAVFYATPLNLSDAKNITMEYSVFFPAGFDWVKGGKLPGLYGGRTGCSGGASAEDCFSTRLMWRRQGAGELYLYAPKNKQTKALCSDPQSVCDSEYGLSIGRGSFHFNTGNWTNLRQEVVLNTPGKQDGAFTLFVDGKQAINRTDICYRDAPTQKKTSKSKTSSKSSTASTIEQTQSGGLGGILGRPQGLSDAPIAEALTITAHETMATQSLIIHAARAPTKQSIPVPDSTNDSQAVGFIGLFFCTFFGGHGNDYATPKQQFAWFKDFAITRNS